MTPKISIIIPVYKVEKYLSRCLDAVLRQTVNDIEAILIDDGSPDGCGRICNEYAQKDPRIKVIHQENAGASAARNSGLDIAAGDYIGFVDSDDCFVPNMFELLLRHMEMSGAEIAFCDYSEISGDPVPSFRQFSADHIESKVMGLKEAFELISDSNKNVGGYIWNKLFRADQVREIRFDPQKKVCHDLEFLMKALSKSSKIVYLPLPLYGYFFQRSGGLTSNADHDHDLAWNLEAYHRDVSMIMDDFSRDNPDLSGPAAAYKCVTADLTVANAMVRSGKIDRQTARIIQTDIRKNLGQIMKSKLRIHKKIQMIIFLISPDLYNSLYKVLKTDHLS